jgi:hypothetical protein
VRFCRPCQPTLSPPIRLCSQGMQASAAKLHVAGAWERALPGLLAGCMLTAALLAAPEAPQDQAAICQRHNGPVACRVW